MENRFAGAQQQGDRRRRRLATDDTDAVSSGADPSLLAEFRNGDVPHVGRLASAAKLGLLDRVISRHLWKHVLVLLAVGGIIGSVLWQTAQSAAASPGRGENTELPRQLTGLLLLFSGQLCFVIGWLRRESEIDFRGRFRWWRWLAAAVTGLAIVMITNTLNLIPHAVAAIVEPFTGPVAAARPALVAVPCLSFCLFILGRILPDMSRCFWSQSLFTIALLTTVVRQMLVFSSAGSTIQPDTMDAMMLMAAFFMFASMLLHCRFVAYICNDPPVRAQKTTVADPAIAVEAQPADNVKEGGLVESDSSGPSAPEPAPTKRKKATRKSRARKRKAA